MTTTKTTQDLTPGTRVRMIGSPTWKGTFVRYYAPLESGTRNVQVDWDHNWNQNLHESQIAAI